MVTIPSAADLARPGQAAQPPSSSSFSTPAIRPNYTGPDRSRNDLVRRSTNPWWDNDRDRWRSDWRRERSDRFYDSGPWHDRYGRSYWSGSPWGSYSSFGYTTFPYSYGYDPTYTYLAPAWSNSNGSEDWYRSQGVIVPYGSTVIVPGALPNEPFVVGAPIGVVNGSGADAGQGVGQNLGVSAEQIRAAKLREQELEAVRSRARLKAFVNPAYDVVPDVRGSLDSTSFGELSTAVSTVRRAAGVNPRGLVDPASPIAQRVSADQDFAQRLRWAAQVFAGAPQQATTPADRAFMQAAYLGMSGDRVGALRAIAQAEALGDQAASTQLLALALREQLEAPVTDPSVSRGAGLGAMPSGTDGVAPAPAPSVPVGP